MSDRSPSLLPRRANKPSKKRTVVPANEDHGSPSLRPTLFCSSPSALASTFERSPLDATTATPELPPELPPELELPPSVQQSHVCVPESPQSRSNGGDRELLSNTAGVNADEEYSRDERLLNEFTKLHPMLRYNTPQAFPSHICSRPPVFVLAVLKGVQSRPCSSLLG
jgi:hypothetical protein